MTTRTTDAPFDRNEPGFHALHRVGPTVHTYVTEFLFLGQHPIHNRSIVVQIPDASGGAGKLAIINPAELRPAVADAIHALEAETGAAVEYLVSPGDWHYLFMGEHLRAFPRARAFVPPGRIPSKSPGFDYTLIDVEADDPFPELAPHLAAHVVRGLNDFAHPDKVRHELVFHIPAIGAITSGDVLYYVGRDTLSPMQQSIGQRARVVDFHFAKWKMIRDPAALQRSLERVLTWDFDRYISIHGDPGNMVERGARADVAAVLAWARNPPA
jgi:hypothetical protein